MQYNEQFDPPLPANLASFSCDNVGCVARNKNTGDCMTALVVVGQTQYRHLPKGETQFTPDGLARAIDNYEKKEQIPLCRPGIDMVLAYAIAYAREVVKIMLGDSTDRT